MLRLGSLSFEFPVVQAALAGYSDAPMRIIARQFGAPFAFHQVLLDKSVAHSPKVRRRLLNPLRPDDHPVGGQLMGSEPDQFAEAAEHMLAHGYDLIDINFGCPVKKVLGRQRGGFLMGDPPTAIAIMKAVRAAVPSHVPLTVKLRRGIDYSAASERDFFRILDAAFEIGLDAATVHPRSVKQRYNGRSDWAFLARVKQHVGDRVVLGSGDLYDAYDIQRMMAQTGVDGVTAARGCIGNPWLFRDARAVLAGQPLPEPPSVAEQGRVLRRHLELSLEEHGARATRAMRKTAIRYSDLHPTPGKLRPAFVKVATVEEFHKILDEWYNPTRTWPPGRRRRAPDDVGKAPTCPASETY